MPPQDPPAKTDITPRSDAESIIRFAQQYLSGAPFDADIGNEGAHPIPAILVANGLRVESLKPIIDSWRLHPERRRGTARVTDLASLCAYIERWKAPNSIVFCKDDRAAPELVAVLDHHQPTSDGRPEFGDHRAVYAFPLDEAWKAWLAADRKPMDQGDFAAFIEDRMGDLIAVPQSSGADSDPLFQMVQGLGGAFASPSTVVELSRGLAVHVGETVKQAVNLQTGEVQVVYQSQHSDGAGGTVKAPGWFLIAVPVFRNGPPYRLGVRLRYRAGGGKISWFVQLWQPDRIIDHAIAEACDKVRERTGLTVLLGTPEM